MEYSSAAPHRTVRARPVRSSRRAYERPSRPEARPLAIVVFGPVMPCQIAQCPAGVFITTLGIVAGSTSYGRSPVSEARVKSVIDRTLPAVVPSTTATSLPLAGSNPTAYTASPVTRSMPLVPLRPSTSRWSNPGTRRAAADAGPAGSAQVIAGRPDRTPAAKQARSSP